MHDVTITSYHITPFIPSNPDLDELEVYGSESQSSGPSTLASYKFEVCDSLLNIGPIKDMALGMPAFLSVSLLEKKVQRLQPENILWLLTHCYSSNSKFLEC